MDFHEISSSLNVLFCYSSRNKLADVIFDAIDNYSFISHTRIFLSECPIDSHLLCIWVHEKVSPLVGVSHY